MINAFEGYEMYTLCSNCVDILGDLVLILDTVCNIGGDFSLEWLTTDSKGNRIPTGVYLCRATDGHRNLSSDCYIGDERLKHMGNVLLQ